jgi:hypothetical protein
LKRIELLLKRPRLGLRALALLGELAASEVLPLTLDKSERVWQAAFSALSFGLEGGGTRPI